MPRSSKYRCAETTKLKVKLSTLWVFVMFNYLYADVIALFDAVGSKKGTIYLTQGMWLGIAVLLEIPMATVVLSRVLKYRANRWANIISGAIETTAVILFTCVPPLFNGTTVPPYYIFFGTIETACTLLIVWYAWTWAEEEA